MRPSAFSFIDTRRHDEGGGRVDSRKSKVGDTSLRTRSVLNQNISLRQDEIVLTSSILAPDKRSVDADSCKLTPFKSP